jgi:hypothetical protein
LDERENVDGDDSKPPVWLRHTVQKLAHLHIGDKRPYKVYFASDSPKMLRLFKQLYVQAGEGDKVIVYDYAEAATMEGRGAVFAGRYHNKLTYTGSSTGPNTGTRTSNGTGNAARRRRRRSGKDEEAARLASADAICGRETERAWMEMLLLGYSDLLVIGKTSGYVNLPVAMVMGRGKTYCRNYLLGPPTARELAFLCHERGGYAGMKMHLVPVPLNSTGQQSAR